MPDWAIAVRLLNTLVLRIRSSSPHLLPGSASGLHDKDIGALRHPHLSTQPCQSILMGTQYHHSLIKREIFGTRSHSSFAFHFLEHNSFLDDYYTNLWQIVNY